MARYSFTPRASTSFVSQFVSAPSRNQVQTQTISVLPLRVVECTGGEFSAAHAVTNVVSKYDNVYCARRNHSTVVFAIDSQIGMITEINIVAPPPNRYSCPVQHIAIFPAMTQNDLVERTDEYLKASTISHLFTHKHAPVKGRPSDDIQQDWELFQGELDQEPREDEDTCVAQYHLCHALYKDDLSNYGQVLDMGDHQTRLHSVTGPASKHLQGPNDESGTYALGISTKSSHAIKTRVSDSKWKSHGPLEPIALASIPRSDEYRHMRIRLSKPVVCKYVAVKFSHPSERDYLNVDVENFAIRGVVNQSSPITFA